MWLTPSPVLTDGTRLQVTQQFPSSHKVARVLAPPNNKANQTNPHEEQAILLPFWKGRLRIKNCYCAICPGIPKLRSQEMTPLPGLSRTEMVKQESSKVNCLDQPWKCQSRRWLGFAPFHPLLLDCGRNVGAASSLESSRDARVEKGEILLSTLFTPQKHSAPPAWGPGPRYVQHSKTEDSVQRVRTVRVENFYLHKSISAWCTLPFWDQYIP